MKNFFVIGCVCLLAAIASNCDSDRDGPGGRGTPDGSLGPPIDLVASGNRAASANYAISMTTEPLGGVAQSENYRFECSTGLAANVGEGGGR